MHGLLHDVWIFVTTTMLTWHQGKLFIEHLVTIPHESIHVIAGVLVWLAVAWLSRRPVTAWRPWLWLFAVILFNETVDLWIEQWPDPGQQYGEGAKDLLVTMIVPTIIMVAARLRPQLFQRR
jgi:hypothetical protein